MNRFSLMQTMRMRITIQVCDTVHDLLKMTKSADHRESGKFKFGEYGQCTEKERVEFSMGRMGHCFSHVLG